MSRPTAPAPGGRAARLLRGVGALIVLSAVVAGVPMLMAVLHMVPHAIPSLHQLGQGLRQRDNGQVAGAVIAAGVWISWALFTLSLIPEIAAAASRRPSRPLPGLAAFQRPAGTLIAVIVIGFTVAPVTTGIPTSRADTPPLPSARPVAAAIHPTSSAARTGAPADADRPAGDATPAAAAAATPAAASRGTYQVQRRDTLWKIASDHLGNPMRYPEIVALNPRTIGADNEITVGAVLTMPADATGLPTPGTGAGNPATTEVQVADGDTLWSIEQRVTGNGANWQAGWEANQGRPEPGGDHFDDPDLIRAGWRLNIPTPAAAMAPPRTTGPAPRPPAAPRTAPQHGPPTPTQPTPTPPAPASASAPPSAPAASSSPAASAAPTKPPAGRAAARPDTHRAAASAQSRYAALEVGGGLLAATTLAAVMTYRRRTFRHRRPGHVAASLPPDLAPLERALARRGRTAMATMTFLDLALRDLAERISAEPGGALPDVVGAGINEDHLELYLAGDPGRPPQPWLATDPLRWTLPRDAELDVAASRRLAPYPCLVSVGYSQDGTEYLLDLEHTGALQLVGDPSRCLELARYLVAELANNAWSDHLTVTVAGFAQELLHANPSRLAHTDDLRTAAATAGRVAADNRDVAGHAGVDVLEGRLRGTDADVWMPHVLLAHTAQGSPDEPGTGLLHAAGCGRSAVAVVLTGPVHPDEHANHVEVTGGGALVTTLLPVPDLTAFRLPLADAADLARAIALNRDGGSDETTPRSTGDHPWDTFTDTAGALLPEHTVPRAGGVAVSDPAATPTSTLLPRPDAAYLAAAATTAEDLAQLAPAVTARTRAAVEQADPDLDELLAAWHDPDPQLAKLQVLGPVTVTAHGRPPAKQEDFCTEIVAYLWSKPNGVTTDEFANDLWPRKNYTGTDSYPKDMASRVRHWLGTDPRTGTEYWPRARRGGVQGYRLDGLLVDYDLFRRLRARGQARGKDGLSDLVTALDLVSGAPWSRLREFGYGWLPVGEELLYQGAIAEVAHLLATRALEAGDDAEAIRACQIALQIDAADDRALVALAKAHDNAGRHAEKEAAILRLKTLEDPPARTLEIMRRNGWLSRGA